MSSLGDGDYTVRISGVTPASRSGLRLRIGANARVFNCAAVSGINIDLGGVGAARSQSFRLRHGYAPHADYDPSFLHAVALSNTTDQYDSPNCASRTYATANLKWNLPNPRPDVLVLDRGKRTGAEGAVTLDGADPAIYRVVAGDTLASIAQRFGISVDDLFYLNPQRGIGEDPDAKESEILNLKRRFR